MPEMLQLMKLSSIIPLAMQDNYSTTTLMQPDDRRTLMQPNASTVSGGPSGVRLLANDHEPCNLEVANPARHGLAVAAWQMLFEIRNSAGGH